MLSLSRPLVWLLSALVFALVVSTARAENTVTLRAESVVAGPVVRLSAVANLHGPGVAELGVLPLRTATAGRETLSLEDVRTALAEAGVNLGRLRLRGASACSVEVREAAMPRAPQVGSAPGPLPPTPADAVTPHAGTAAGQVPAAHVPGERLRDRLAVWLGLDEAQARTLRLSSADADAGLLRRAALAGAGFRFEPLGRPRLGRVSVRLHERRADGGTTLHSVSIELEREVLAVVATAPIRRGDTFSSENVAIERTRVGRESAPSAAPLDSLDGVLGSLAEVTLLPGTPIVPGHLSRPALVRRGGHVTVRVMAGAVELVAEGVAEADAAHGESVSVRLGRTRGRDARTVVGVVSGTGEVSVHQL